MALWTVAEKALAKADPQLKGLIKAVGPCTIKPQKVELYASLLSSIAHQQLHGKAAQTILGRFKDMYGGEVPRPEQLIKTKLLKLRACGFSESKSLALIDVATKTLEGIVPTRKAALKLENDELIKRITAVRGVGRWTVEMLLMFNLARPDVLPVDDFGVREGFKVHYGHITQPKPKELAVYGEAWAPWRTVASWYMWRALDLSRVKQP